jgi:hypothetical protein
MDTVKVTVEVCLDDDIIGRMGFRTPPNHQELVVGCQRRKNLSAVGEFGYIRSGFEGYLGNQINAAVPCRTLF